MDVNGNKHKTFKEWIDSNEELIVAEGYVMEFERRGFLKSDNFIPEVVLQHPHLVKQSHEEFVFCGSDVVLSLTYNAHRKRLSLIGQGDIWDTMNTKALEIAKEVAKKNGSLFAGSMSHSMTKSNVEDAESIIRELFTEQINLFKHSGVDFVVAETLGGLLEAKVAIDLAKEAGIPIVVTFNMYRPNLTTHEGMSVVDACQKAEEMGADVVGVNCGRGPLTIIPILKEMRKKCKGPLAALPVCFRTTDEEPSWMQLTHPETGKPLYPKDISMMQAPPSDIEIFAKACRENGIRYIGLCCGNNGRLTTVLAETLGRIPPSSRFSNPDADKKELIWLKD